MTYFFVDAMKLSATLLDLFLIGLFWVTITVVFEFGFGHYVVKHSWEHLIADYNLLKGRVV